MNILVDNNISPSIASLLQNAGHSAIHVKDIGMSAANDFEIFKHAADNNMTIISADTDFGYILSSWKNNLPSVMLLRFLPPSTAIQIKYILTVVEKFEKEILEGNLIIVEPSRVRIRKLPFTY